jgi:hypothetical protein
MMIVYTSVRVLHVLLEVHTVVLGVPRVVFGIGMLHVHATVMPALHVKCTTATRQVPHLEAAYSARTHKQRYSMRQICN